MKTTTTTYNERSWAIDLIGHLKYLATSNNRSIKDAGGEQTIRTDGGSLFPDVLLFGDRETARILQGWELKMPDTSIFDVEFRKNAEIKANALGLDSFILWNVSQAHLFVRDNKTKFFSLSKTWDSLADITDRGSVRSSRIRWQALATEIFNHLNDLFDSGIIEGRPFVDAYQSGGVTSLILENSVEVRDSIVNIARRNNVFRAEITLWWDRYRAEYGDGEMEYVLAQAVISNWIGKILFGHILREKDIRAQRILNIDSATTPEQALELFRQLSEDCNFWTIFSESIALKAITQRAWNQLKEFSRLLSDLRLGSVDQAQLSGILEATVAVAIRKLRGQYPTPISLARLLVQICVRNIVDDRILDPCCGSGTIARAALEQKILEAVNPEEAAQQVYASDQDPQAIQIATFALAKPTLMHKPIKIFQYDAFGLQSTQKVDFRDPSTGTKFTEELGQFETIVSNLPFVGQAGRKQYGNALNAVVSRMGMGKFTKRADVAAYLPFSLHPLLSENGRLGIIITNAWLGTDWGDDFYSELGNFYDLKCVITSGAGRWFHNSSVVTNLLVLDKKADPNCESGNVKFITLTRPLEAIDDDSSVKLLAAQIELGQTQNDSLMVRSISPSQLLKFRSLGLGGNAQFVNCDWILDLPLVKITDIFEVRRGERRGMNEFFYPKPGHNIEQDYIRPLAKSPNDFKMLTMQPTKEAFCCSLTEEELEELGHLGALSWIRKFKTDENISKLGSSNKLWYQMDVTDLSDLVMFINFGDRLFSGRVDPPAFSDQRLVPLKPKSEVDLDLYHAILNSTIAMFIMEGMGFGRGQGALDLSKDRIENYMHVLDVSVLNSDSIAEIKDAFRPLMQRKILSVADELEQNDRKTFDDVVISSFNLGVTRDAIYDSLLALIEIRLTAIH